MMNSLIIPTKLPEFAVKMGSSNKVVISTEVAAANHPLAAASVSSPSSPSDEQQRRSANYQPPTWNFDHIQSLDVAFEGESHRKQASQLKEEINAMLDSKSYGMLEQLELIDDLQRLGLSYHFETRVKQILEKIYTKSYKNDLGLLDGKDKLYATALYFRLLRQHGFKVSQDIFCYFLENGELKPTLQGDTKGLVYLYEASYLLVEGEDILELVMKSTIQHLKKNLDDGKLDDDLGKLVINALELPLHWRMNRLETRRYIDVYETRLDLNPILLEMAKLDFNMVQTQHLQDIKDASKWWKRTHLAEELTFARDRIVECFYWTIGFKFEPKYAHLRQTLTKVISFINTIDDVYDVYGTLNELELFTSAIERWDISAIDQLPDYMKICFLALDSNINDMAHVDLKHLGSDNIVHHLRKSWGDLCKSYLKEAKWYFKGYTPTLEEYLNNAWISVGGPVTLVHVYFLVTFPIEEEALEHLQNYHDIIRWSSMIVRLTDDLATSSVHMVRRVPASWLKPRNRSNTHPRSNEVEGEDGRRLRIRSRSNEVEGRGGFSNDSRSNEVEGPHSRSNEFEGPYVRSNEVEGTHSRRNEVERESEAEDEVEGESEAEGESDAIVTSGGKRKRGATRGLALLKARRQQGGRLPLTFDPHHRKVVGKWSEKFTNECGIIIRTELPPDAMFWKDISLEKRREFRYQLTASFDFDPKPKFVEDIVNLQLQTALKTFRNRMHTKFKKCGGVANLDLAKKCIPVEMENHQTTWEKWCDVWANPKMQALCEKNSENRAKRPYQSRTGSISIANHHLRRGGKLDDVVGQIETYYNMHHDDKKGWLSERAKDAYADMMKMREEYPYHPDDPESLRDTDIMELVLGKKSCYTNGWGSKLPPHVEVTLHRQEQGEGSNNISSSSSPPMHYNDPRITKLEKVVSELQQSMLVLNQVAPLQERVDRIEEKQEEMRLDFNKTLSDLRVDVNNNFEDVNKNVQDLKESISDINTSNSSIKLLLTKLVENSEQQKRR